MFPTPVSILLACTAAALLLHAVGVWAAFRRTRRRASRVEPERYPGLSLLKPLKGLEDDLAGNLHSFLSQRYPGPLEFVFCATDPDDAGLAVAREVAAQHPVADVRFVVSRDDYGMNPKVSNMQGGLAQTRHPWVLQSDGNVRIEAGYLRRLMREALHRDADMVGSLVVGEGEQTLGAALENLQLTAFIAPAVCIAQEVANVPCVIGKSMLLRRAALDAVGGLDPVRDLLAEDFVLARSFQRAGLRVHLSPLTVSNVNRGGSVAQFTRRHARWLKMRAVIHAPAFLADLLANPSIFPLFAWALGGFDARIGLVYLAVVAYRATCDQVLMRRLRGRSLPVRYLWLSPVRDLMLAGIWWYSAFSRRTSWRGRSLRLGPNSRLLSPEGEGLTVNEALGHPGNRAD